MPDFTADKFFEAVVLNDVEDIFEYDQKDIKLQEDKVLTSGQGEFNAIDDVFMSAFETLPNEYFVNECQKSLTKKNVKEQGSLYYAELNEKNGFNYNNESTEVIRKKGEENLSDIDLVDKKEEEESLTCPVNEVLKTTAKNKNVFKDKYCVPLDKDVNTFSDFVNDITESYKPRERECIVYSKEDLMDSDEEIEPASVDEVDKATLKVGEFLSYQEFLAKAEEPIPGPMVDLQGHTSPIFLQGIQGDFKWPSHLAGPSSHAMGWRKSPGSAGDVVTVRGNRSISSVLEEAGALGQQAAFLLQCQSEGEQLGGVLHLRELADGQAASNCPAFQLQGKEGWLSLKELVSLAGYSPDSFLALGDPYYNRKPGGITMAARVLLYMGEKMTNLQELTDQWKQVLLQDSRRLKEEKEQVKELGQEQEPGQAKLILEWLKRNCMKTTENATVCLYCGLICYEQSISQNFMKHMKNHLFRKGHGIQTRKRKQCSECNKSFKERKPLKLHMVSAHSVSPDELVNLKECPFCKVFIPQEDMNIHRISSHLNDTLKCQNCNASFMNEHLLRAHCNNVHNTKYNYKGICSFCHKEFPNIRNHMKKGHTSVKCNHCDKIFTTQKGLTTHMHSVNGTVPKRQCPECFKYIINVTFHIRTVHRGEMKPFRKNKKRCVVCRKFVLKDEYDYHKHICKPHVCSICFKPVQELERHLLKAHSEGLKCVLCADNKAFQGNKNQSQKGQLRSHIYETHMQDIFLELGITENLDTEDEKCREDIAQYFVDRKSTREGDEHTCQICLEVCNRGTKIFNHMKYHLKYLLPGKPKSRPCAGCGKMMSKINLNEHVCSDPQTRKPSATVFPPTQTTPASNLKHICPECGKLFGEKYRLERHMQIHTRLKDVHAGSKLELRQQTQASLTPAKQQTLPKYPSPSETIIEHNCQQCGSSFKQTYLLERHMKAHISQKEEPGTTKRVKCSCAGCSLQSCGECQTCKNKHFKKRCLKRRCVS